MTTSFTTLLVAFVVAAFATGLVVLLARRAGRLDVPDPSRRIHTMPTPRLGGIGIAAGLAVGWATAYLLDGQAARRGSLELGIAVGSVLFFAIGLVDDLRRSGRGLPAWAKWFAQLVAAVVPVAMGLRWTGVVDPNSPWPYLGMGSASAVMTVLWILAVVNVVNFLDGIDLIVAVTALVCIAAPPAVWGGLPPVRHSAACGALVGFALWNSPTPRARAFMGDGGSHLVGFFVATLACGVAVPVGTTRVSVDAIEITVRVLPSFPWPLVTAPLLPAILDVIEALIHKARVGVPMSQAHADHLYQRLVKAGSPAWLVALRYGGLSLAGVLLAGPVAERWGLVAAIVPGVALLVLHWVQGTRATRNVPRLARS